MTMTTTIPGVEVVTEPRDLHALLPWLNLVRRLRSAALNNGSYSAIKITVITDRDGQPIQWTRPTVTPIEPRAGNGALDTLISALGE